MGINRSKLMSVSSQTSSTSNISDAEVTFDDFQILRAIGKGSFGKVKIIFFLKLHHIHVHDLAIR